MNKWFSWLSCRTFDELRTVYKFLFRRRSLYEQEDLEDQPFFIIGSGRSGNTLLRAMLTTHPDIVIPPESCFLPEVIREYSRMSFLPWSMLHRAILGLIIDNPEFYMWELEDHRLYEKVGEIPDDNRTLYGIVRAVYDLYEETHQPGAKIWGDKTPLNTHFLPLIDRLFPRARYIHMIRDGRDVAASFRRAGLTDGLEEGAEKWLSALDNVKRFRDQLPSDRFMRVDYESLVRSPEEQLKRVTDYLDVDFDPTMLDYWKQAEELGDVPEYEYHSQVYEPVNTDALGRWKDLPSSERDLLNEKLADELRTWGYGE